eukprot:CAMPEP_0172662402 /NCGR_PEP_ID=MMETSP1074-20121228/5343_1 /TAXON_ID=2916 /ORGANISM="Ceratium fusus, Strain PA161109" /LENGTH=381 /DNA_ID=CAMNT_0013478315 /DNA_START=48 /DNA_END=1193 /DNA_ORIENTATION=+
MGAMDKRGPEEDAPRPKRSRALRQKEPVDPVAKQCNTISEALHSAALPSLAKETLDAVILHALALHREDRHDYQEQMVQALGNTLQDLEGDLRKRLAEAERELQEVIAKAEDLKQEQADAEESAKAALNVSLEKKEALAQTALKFREAKRGLEEARRAEEVGCKEFHKFAGDSEVLALALTDIFEPLKNGTLKPAQRIQEAEQLMSSLRGRLELDATLEKTLPKALITPISERSSFTTMVVHQFEETLVAHIEDLRSGCEAEDSSKEVWKAAVLSAEKVFETADGHQRAAAKTFTADNDFHKRQTQVVNEKKKAVRDTRPLVRNCESSLAELQIKLDDFQKGPLEAFKMLQCRAKPLVEGALMPAPEGEATAPPAEETNDF